VSREPWAGVAAGWERYAGAFHVRTLPVSSWMVEAIAPQPGHTILDLAAGVGDTGFLAAELIEPGGTLITSDYSPEMLTAAQRRAAALGLRNVRFRQVDATQPIDVAAASLDGVLCRWGYMLMDDAEPAMRETRRVLRPGGRLALAAWTEAGENPWTSLPLKLLVERGLVDPPEPGPGQFAWAPEGVIAEHLESAGFVEYDVDTIEFTMGYESVREWWETTRAMGRLASGARIDDEPEWLDTLAGAAAGWTAADGSLAIPARTWVAAATA
jgi:ubiquinone/menaquinone biosynthesis C-methylase UbiE